MVLIKCHAGCPSESVVEALGLRWIDLFPPKETGDLGSPVATYRYEDEIGKLLYEVIRFHPKTFRQRRANGDWKLGDVRRVLYRLPEIADSKRAVWVVEGEKDADNVANLGLLATTKMGGASGWLPSYSETLRGRHVLIVPDNDDPGYAYAEHVTAALLGIAATVRIVVLPHLKPKGDVSDWIAAGGTRSDLEALAKAVRPEEPMPTLKIVAARVAALENEVKRLKAEHNDK